MSCFPPPKPIDSFCHRCGVQLNYYGICPNQQKHLDDDTKRHNEYKDKKEQERQHLESLLDSVFSGKPIPTILSGSHNKHVWEPYGDDKQCCKLCGIIAFNRDLRI